MSRQVVGLVCGAVACAAALLLLGGVNLQCSVLRGPRKVRLGFPVGPTTASSTISSLSFDVAERSRAADTGEGGGRSSRASIRGGKLEEEKKQKQKQKQKQQQQQQQQQEEEDADAGADDGALAGSAASATFERVVPDLSGRDEDVLPDVAAEVLALERQGRGRKIIAVSLFGSTPKYTQGAVENAMLVARDWPGWTYRVYLGDGVPPNVTALVRAFGGEIVSVRGSFQARECSTFWRFYALEDPTATRVLVRDTDSRLTLRDQTAVAEWMESDHLFHTTHDHQAHVWPVVGGAWGAVAGLVNPRLLAAWRRRDAARNATCVWGLDQDWLGEVVWPQVKAYALQHASWHCGEFGAAEVRGWPTKRETERDMGVVNVHDPWNHWQGLAYYPECPAECRRKPEWTHC